MIGLFEIDAFVIIVAELIGIGRVEDDVAGLRTGADLFENQAERNPFPFADGAPSLDAIVAGDLGSRREVPKRGEGESGRLLDPSADLQSPVGEIVFDQGEIFGRAGLARCPIIGANEEAPGDTFVEGTETCDEIDPAPGRKLSATLAVPPAPI